jgi:hypothetical protein
MSKKFVFEGWACYNCVERSFFEDFDGSDNNIIHLELFPSSQRVREWECISKPVQVKVTVEVLPKKKEEIHE